MSNFFEKERYYNGIADCCCFNKIMSSETTRLTEKMDLLNRMLPSNLKIVSWGIYYEDESKYDHGETDVFFEVYKDYRSWLLDKYLDSEFSFAQNYYVRPSDYKDYRVFFAQTLMRFLQEYLSGSYEYRHINPHIKDERLQWNDKGIVAHKMLIAAALICNETKPRNFHIPYGFSILSRYVKPGSSINGLIDILHEY